MKFFKKPLFLAYSGGIIFLLIDFITKLLANRLLPFQESVPTFLPFLTFYRTHNIGYHFLFGTISNQKLWAISGIVIVTILTISLTRSILKEKEAGFNLKIMTIILSLMIGAAGNVIEVLVTGKATDFFLFHPFPWPSNLCDQYINAIIYIMLPIMLIKSFVNRRKSKKTDTTPE